MNFFLKQSPMNTRNVGSSTGHNNDKHDSDNHINGKNENELSFNKINMESIYKYQVCFFLF